jgi:acyl carrier protein
MQPVVTGVAGELYLAGEGLARGYLKRPEQTAEKFIPNPFAEQAGERLYRTGDLARRRADGQLEFLGRIDHQVKIRGFRIELGEIEATLNKHHGLERAVVVALDGSGDKRLVAYAVARPAASLTTAELRGFLSETLPDYMIPSTFVMLDQLPLTPNGKVDRQALPAPDASRRDVAGEWVAPRNACEEALVKMWGEVLGLERVGIHDNFFELGGHSLLATQVIAKLTETFRVELPLRTLFEAPTVSGLAAAIETAQADHAAATPVPDIQPVSRDAYRRQISSRQEIQVPDILIKRKN